MSSDRLDGNENFMFRCQLELLEQNFSPRTRDLGASGTQVPVKQQS